MYFHVMIGFAEDSPGVDCSACEENNGNMRNSRRWKALLSMSQ